MLFSTLPQFVVLGLLLFGGLILGLGLHPGSKKWRNALDEESDQYAAYRRDADTQLRDANRRIAELERENAALNERETKMRGLVADMEAKPATPVAVAEAPPAPPAPMAEPVAVAAAVPVLDPEVAAESEDIKKSWFSMGGADDLSRMRSIDGALKDKLGSLGVGSFADIEKLSAEDEMALEQRVDLAAGFIAREQWRDQAALLRAGKTEEHRARFWAQA